MSRILCVIPARAGSVRIPRKNWAKIGEQTLVDHAANAARESGVCNRTLVYSDSAEWPYGVIRGDHTDGDICFAVRDVLQQLDARGEVYDYVVTLQPATPLRSGRLIYEMIDRMQKEECLGAITMAPTVPWLWHEKDGMAGNSWSPGAYPRSQDVQVRSFQEINTVQIAHRDVVLAGKRWQLPLLVTHLPHWAVLDIDVPADLDECRRLWAPLKAEFDQRSGFGWHVVRELNGESAV